MSPRKPKLLLIEDDLDVRQVMSDMLEDEFEILTSDDGEAGIRVAKASLPDMILLDINMPKMNGVDACDILRRHEATRHIPIMMVSGSDDHESRTHAFQVGADDFVGKPFRAEELIARIKSKMRRLEEAANQNEIVTIGKLTLDFSKLEAKVSQRVIPLSVLEFNLLKYLIQNNNKVLARQQILEAVWRDSVVSDRTVDTHIAFLRKKIAGSQVYITTVYGAGYVLKLE